MARIDVISQHIAQTTHAYGDPALDLSRNVGDGIGEDTFEAQIIAAKSGNSSPGGEMTALTRPDGAVSNAEMKDERGRRSFGLSVRNAALLGLTAGLAMLNPVSAYGWSSSTGVAIGRGNGTLPANFTLGNVTVPGNITFGNGTGPGNVTLANVTLPGNFTFANGTLTNVTLPGNVTLTNVTLLNVTLANGTSPVNLTASNSTGSYITEIELPKTEQPTTYGSFRSRLFRNAQKL